MFAWQVGQEVTLKKPHPCGGRRWTIYKLGRDIGLQCRQCGQRVKLLRRKFERAVETERCIDFRRRITKLTAEYAEIAEKS